MDVDCLVLLLPLLFEVIEYCFDHLDHPLVAFIISITSALRALEEAPIHSLVPLCLGVQLRLLAPLCWSRSKKIDSKREPKGTTSPEYL